MNKPPSERSFFCARRFHYSERATLRLQGLRDSGGLFTREGLITGVGRGIYFTSISLCFLKTAASPINSGAEERKRGGRFHLTLASDSEPLAAFCFFCLISFHRRLIVKGDIMRSGSETPAAVGAGKQLSASLFSHCGGRKTQRHTATPKCHRRHRRRAK